MTTCQRVRVIEDMKGLLTLVDDSTWVQKARSFIKALEAKIFFLADKEFYAYLKRWQTDFLNEVEAKIMSKIALQGI
ncbi:hypothetical protein ACFL2U_02940 [Patescibacteria group bacterium]